MLTVAEFRSCAESRVEADPWIPLKISWALGVTVDPLYLYLKGNDGGYVELRVDAGTGAIYTMVVIEAPPTTTEPTVLPPAVLERKGVPVVDLGLWPKTAGPDGDTFKERTITAQTDLSFRVGGEFAVLSLSQIDATVFGGCGDVAVGMSAESELVLVVARTPVPDYPTDYPASVS